MKSHLPIVLFFISFLGFSQDAYQPKKYVELQHPEWSKNATIYEVNLRQFTPEGTFKAFEAHLPRLKSHLGKLGMRNPMSTNKKESFGTSNF